MQRDFFVVSAGKVSLRFFLTQEARKVCFENSDLFGACKRPSWSWWNQNLFKLNKSIFT
jgi:hypothetical protein